MSEKLVGYMGRDQWGNTFHIGNNPPRKWLCDHLCRQHVEKMFIDKTDGTVAHIGYIIAGHWIRLYEVKAFERND
jgi:hypothetical protein